MPSTKCTVTEGASGKTIPSMGPSEGIASENRLVGDTHLRPLIFPSIHSLDQKRGTERERKCVG